MPFSSAVRGVETFEENPLARHGQPLCVRVRAYRTQSWIFLIAIDSGFSRELMTVSILILLLSVYVCVCFLFFG